jgi:hypothetical protein
MSGILRLEADLRLEAEAGTPADTTIDTPPCTYYYRQATADTPPCTYYYRQATADTPPCTYYYRQATADAPRRR